MRRREEMAQYCGYPEIVERHSARLSSHFCPERRASAGVWLSEIVETAQYLSSLKLLIRPQKPPLPHRQIVQPHFADTDAFQPQHFQPDHFAHAADLPVLAFAQN